MNKETEYLKGRELVKKLINKFEKCLWTKAISDTFTLSIGNSIILITKNRLKVTTQSGVDLLDYTPSGENSDAHDLAVLYSKAYAVHEERMNRVYNDFIAHLDALL